MDNEVLGKYVAGVSCPEGTACLAYRKGSVYVDKNGAYIRDTDTNETLVDFRHGVTVVNPLNLTIQDTNPAAPEAGFVTLFAKAGGVYARLPGGSVAGPFGAGGGGDGVWTQDGSENLFSSGALLNLTAGGTNLAAGTAALNSLTSGNNNTALGYGTLSGIAGGHANTAIGALYAGTGYAGDLLTDSDSSNICITNRGVPGDVGVTRIGTPGEHTKAYIAGIYGVTPAGASQQTVVMTDDGQLGTIPGGGSVASVTGLYTDNTDPSNPIVGIAVDGVTITGAGTQGDPLVAGASVWTLDANNNLFSTGAGNGTMTGNDNFFSGSSSGASTTTGAYNIGIGYGVLNTNSTGSSNTAIGQWAMQGGAGGNGDRNCAVGEFALSYLQDNASERNTAIGARTFTNLSSGSNNIALGYLAGSAINAANSSDNICIGHIGVSNDTGIIRIGTGGTHTATYIAGDIEAQGSITAINSFYTPDGVFSGYGLNVTDEANIDGVLGLFGATPSGQGAAIPDCTGLTDYVATINAILAQMRARGEIAT